MVGTTVINALQASAPQWSEVAAIVSDLLAALAAGVGIGWLVRSVWVRVESLFAGNNTQTSEA